MITHHAGSFFTLQRLRHARWRPALLWLLVAALLLRGFMPLGMMPDIGKVGSFAIKICSSAGLATILLPADDQPTDKKSSPAHQDCLLCVAPVQADGQDHAPILPAVFALFLLALPLSGAVIPRRPHEIAAARAPPACS